MPERMAPHTRARDWCRHCTVRKYERRSAEERPERKAKTKRGPDQCHALGAVLKGS